MNAIEAMRKAADDLRECNCGCGQRFKPYKDFQEYATPAHRDQFHTKVRTEVMRIAIKDKRLIRKAEQIVRKKIKAECCAAASA